MREEQDLIPKGLKAERLSIGRGSATISVASVVPSACCPVWADLPSRPGPTRVPSGHVAGPTLARL